MTEQLRRGTGPWPSTNTESAVSVWLHGRMGQVEDSERPGMVRWMLDHASGQSKGERLVHDFRWSESLLDRLSVWAERLNGGEPLQHVLGEAWFDGLRISVSPAVLIPRPETEELVEALSSRLQAEVAAPAQIVDWCTGSGCVALALKRRFPEAKVCGWDLSADALDVARANAVQNHLHVAFDVRDALSATHDGTVADAVVSNPPYIPSSVVDALEPVVRDHEPHQALCGGLDGLDACREIVQLAPQALAPGGWLLIEHHHDQSEQVLQLMQASGLVDAEARCDLGGVKRFAMACRAPRSSATLPSPA